MKYEFTEQEVDALLKLIDMAVKAGGMNVAEAGVVLSKKLSFGFTKEEPKEEPKEEIEDNK